MAYGKRFLLMLQFLTTIPVNINIDAAKEDYGKGLAMAPAVGLVVGALLSIGSFIIGKLFPAAITSILTMAIYILLTGGLHLDGLGDTADGLFSNRSKERMLEIMKDSRVGTNALLTVVITLLLYISFLSSMGSFLHVVLLLMPVAGRIGSLIGAGVSTYAGISDGPGRWCVQYCKMKDVLLGVFIYIIIFIAASLLAGMPAILLSAVIPPVSAFLLSKLFGKKLGGVTGDILGAVCELNQVVFLAATFLLLRIL